MSVFGRGPRRRKRWPVPKFISRLCALDARPNVRRDMLFGVAVVLLLVSGCADDAQTSGALASSTSAAVAAPKADAGSIAGLVVDDEQMPITGAQVAIV